MDVGVDISDGLHHNSLSDYDDDYFKVTNNEENEKLDSLEEFGDSNFDANLSDLEQKILIICLILMKCIN